MFEDKTFENILGEMLAYVEQQNPELDTRVGSVIYTALAPIAMELETAYHEMVMIMDEAFLDTASLEYLVKHGNQVGVELREATCGHYVGEFDVAVEIGSRFNLDKFNYNVIDKISDPTDDNAYYTYELVCETAGTEPNGYLGKLTPITFCQNLTHAELVSVISYGEDEEDTEAYRYRIQTHIMNPPLNGNVAQYNEWLDEYEGVGKYKVQPLWNGANTVKLVILDSENKRASDELIANVQEYFDPNSEGMGNGVAPIGAVVTVSSVEEVPVYFYCNFTLKDGYTEAEVTESIINAVDEYLQSMVFEKQTVSYMPISAAVYNAEGVEDVVELVVSVNGVSMEIGASDFIPSITLNSDEIAVLDSTNSVVEVSA